VTRFLTYDVKLDSDCAAYCKEIMALPAMLEWVEGAKAEPTRSSNSTLSLEPFAEAPGPAPAIVILPR